MGKYLPIILFMVSAAITFFNFNHSLKLTNEEIKLTYQKFSLGDNDNPYARIEQEFMMLRDPATNQIPPNIFRRENEFAKKLPKRIKGILYKDNQGNESKALNWTSRGPKNVGGRTRALGIDIRTTEPPNVTIIAGGVSGGLWRSTDDGVTWDLRTLPSQIHNVTCLAQDTREGHENTWYAGSGEGTYNSANCGGAAPFLGDGIFKSINNGLTWAQLPFTVSGTPQNYDKAFDYVHNIAISPTTGSIFAAASNTIQRSTNDGTTFETVLGAFTRIGFTDVQITSTGVVYATLDSTAATPGIWRSTDDGDTWTNITPAGFPARCYRTVIAISPECECDVWFLGETPGDGTLGHSLWNYNSSRDEWINRSANIPSIGGQSGNFNSQKSYDLVIKTKRLIQGNAIFTTSHTLTSSAHGANSVYAEDVDSDGDRDVLSASTFDGTIAWYENDGNENFTPHTITTNADGARSVYAVDVNSDGDMDVLSASLSLDEIAWYENDGNQNFTSHTITTNADGAEAVYAIDVDSDGDIDVLSASYVDYKIAWYENDGNENFTPHTITTNAAGARSVYAADVDSDGDMDVLSASSYDDKIAWYENDGNQNFTPHTITTDAYTASSVYAADVDSDGDMDVLSAAQWDYTIAWYENNGNQNFTLHTIDTNVVSAEAILALDVDRDGDTDVLSAAYYDDKIAWYENDGNQNFTPHAITTSANGAKAVYAVDLDCDGDMDVLSASDVDNKIAWYENTSDITNLVLLGGTNLYRSTDGFETSGATSWIGGYSPSNMNYEQYPNQHPDQHAITFLPESNKIVYTGHDGGISKTNDITSSLGGNEPVVWTSLNNSYHTTQFYSISLAPESGSNVMMGGMQDNGCWFGSGAGSSDWDFYWSGDGTFVEVGPLADDRVYPASQNGRVLRQNRAGTSIVDFTPTGSFNKMFVNPVVIDPNNSSLYYYAAGNMPTNSGVWRNSDLKNATTTNGWSWLGNTGVVPYAPVTALGVSTSNNANVVYYGTNSGPVRRIDNANTGFAVAVTNIKDTLPDAYVSCIAVDPTNSNNALLTFSNYNTVSLWYTDNAGSSWTDVEGNLAGAAGPSIRWASIFYVNNVPHYFLATSVGVYFTNLLNASSTVWAQEAVSDIGNVVCVMLDWRNSDRTLAVATHGRGVFTTSVSTPSPVEVIITNPIEFVLEQNFPNPFNPSTVISYTIPTSVKSKTSPTSRYELNVKLNVYDIRGRKVATLVDDKQEPGNYKIEFDATDLPSGIYFYRIQSGDFVETKKMVLLK